MAHHYWTCINCIYTSWNVALRTLCDLRYGTHTHYLLDHVSGLFHVKHIIQCKEIINIDSMF